MAQDEKYDGIFMNVVQQSKGIHNFYDALFGFMRRRTDFFSDEDQGKTKVIEYFDKHAALFKEDQERKRLIDAKKKEEKARKAQEEADKKRAQEEGEDKCEEVTEEEAAKFEKKEKSEPVDAEMKEDSGTSEVKEVNEDEGTGIVPINNGANMGKYIWSQSLGDCTLSIFIPEGVKAKHLDIVITPSKMKIQIKGSDPILEGEWPEKVKPDDTLWTIEDLDGKRII